MRSSKKLILVVILLLNASVLLFTNSNSSSNQLVTQTQIASISAMQMDALLRQYHKINPTASVQEVLNWLVKQEVEQFYFAELANLQDQMVTKINDRTFLDANLNAIISLPSLQNVVLVMSYQQDMDTGLSIFARSSLLWGLLFINLLGVCYLLLTGKTTEFSHHVKTSKAALPQLSDIAIDAHLSQGEQVNNSSTFAGLDYQDLDFGVCEVNLATEIINYNAAFVAMVDLPVNLSLPIKQDLLWHSTAIYDFHPTSFPSVSNPFTVNALNGNSYILQYYAQDSQHYYLFVRTNNKGSYISQKKLWVNHLRHELSTPLAVMDLILQEIRSKQTKQQPDSDDPVNTFYSTSYATIDAFSTAVNRIKLLTATLDRIDTNNIDEVALPEKALTQVIEDTKGMLVKNRANFDITVDGTQIWIGNSGPSLSTILLNLFDNALKHNDENNISIRVEAALMAGTSVTAHAPDLQLWLNKLANDTVLLIKVMDNGSFIDAATIDKLGWSNVGNQPNQAQTVLVDNAKLYNLVAVDRAAQLSTRRLSGTDICAELCLRLSGLLLYKSNPALKYGNEFWIIIPKSQI